MARWASTTEATQSKAAPHVDGFPEKGHFRDSILPSGACAGVLTSVDAEPVMESIAAKLTRADELVANLAHEASAFEQSAEPPRLEKGFKPGTSTYAFFAHGRVDVPLRFAVLAGEVVHHLRSSLDHLVAALVQENGGVVTNTHQFPICSTRDRYRAFVRRGCLRGISASAEKRIEGYQPFNASDPAVSELLGIQALDNSDKHRLLVVVAAATQVGTNVRVSCGENATITGMSPPQLQLPNGSEFFSVDFLRRYESTNVDIDVRTVLALQRPAELHWPFAVAPLMLVLNQCNRAVQHVVQRCLAADAEKGE